MSILELQNVRKIYGEKENQVKALQNVNMQVEEGEFVAIVGTFRQRQVHTFKFNWRSGQPHAGKNLYKKQGDWFFIQKGTDHFRRRNIGFVFQNYSLMPVLNVYDNVALPITFDRGKHINHKYIEELLRELGLWEKRKKYPNELSGGQQQRVAIARALVNKPAILLCDEPTGNLDSATTIEVMGLLKSSCRKYKQTILMVTHNEAIAQTCDRVIHIEDGEILTGKRSFQAKGGEQS